ncbi:MAG: DUF2062 domain-containing protein [Lentisphaerae bacterium]|nr:DUF2062 domain-containing protein [Lentisphaerota bacterium]
MAKLRILIVSLLRQGTSPTPLAACIALSAVIGVFPIIGVPTPLLTVIVLARRWNLPVAQAVNYLATPFQWLLIVPCIRIGEWLLRAAPIPLSPAEIVARLRAAPGDFFRDFSTAAAHAVLGWLVIGAPLFLILFSLSRAILRRATRRHSTNI